MRDPPQLTHDLRGRGRGRCPASHGGTGCRNRNLSAGHRLQPQLRAKRKLGERRPGAPCYSHDRHPQRNGSDDKARSVSGNFNAEFCCCLVERAAIPACNAVVGESACVPILFRPLQLRWFGPASSGEEEAARRTIYVYVYLLPVPVGGGGVKIAASSRRRRQQPVHCCCCLSSQVPSPRPLQ